MGDRTMEVEKGKKCLKLFKKQSSCKNIFLVAVGVQCRLQKKRGDRLMEVRKEKRQLSIM